MVETETGESSVGTGDIRAIGAAVTEPALTGGQPGTLALDLTLITRIKPR